MSRTEPSLAEAYENAVALKAQERKLLLAQMAATIAGGIEASLGVEGDIAPDKCAQRALNVANFILLKVGL